MITDTTPEIKQKQLEIWLLKTPMERLRQTLEDNDALFTFWNTMKENILTDKTVNGCGTSNK